ncbi:unnamed protein product, partial [Didymodactylos carnosus]
IISFAATLTRRWPNVKISDSSDSSDNEYRMDIDDEELNFNDKLLLTDIGDLAEMCPKYHCELNTIQGLWCNQKAFVFTENCIKIIPAFLAFTTLTKQLRILREILNFVKDDYSVNEYSKS